MKNLLFAFFALFVFNGVSFGQTGGCIPLPKGLEKIIKDPLNMPPTNPFGKGNKTMDEQSEKYIIDYLVAFENSIKNKNSASSSNAEAKALSYKKSVENSPNYKWLQSMIAKSNNDYFIIRDQIKEKLNNTSDIETVRFLVLVDYQFQIVKHYESSFSNLQGKGGLDWGCVGTWTGTGAGIGGALGSGAGGVGAGPGAVAGAVIGFMVGLAGC